VGEFLPQVGCSSNVTLFLSPINTKKHSSTVIKIPTMPTPQLSVTFYNISLKVDSDCHRLVAMSSSSSPTINTIPPSLST